jgi:threonine/homoserine/homoserine lactone efflux protein
VHPALQVVAALVPSVGVGFLFWLAIRTIISADRRERVALARMDAEESARAAAERSQQTSD